MKKIVMLLLLCCSSALAQLVDCKTQALLAEEIICSDEQLLAMDQELSELFDKFNSNAKLVYRVKQKSITPSLPYKSELDEFLERRNNDLDKIELLYIYDTQLRQMKEYIYGKSFDPDSPSPYIKDMPDMSHTWPPDYVQSIKEHKLLHNKRREQHRSQYSLDLAEIFFNMKGEYMSPILVTDNLTLIKKSMKGCENLEYGFRGDGTYSLYLDNETYYLEYFESKKNIFKYDRYYLFSIDPKSCANKYKYKVIKNGKTLSYKELLDLELNPMPLGVSRVSTSVSKDDLHSAKMGLMKVNGIVCTFVSTKKEIDIKSKYIVFSASLFY